MPPIELTPASGRYLSFTEREDLALLSAKGMSMRDIAGRIGRSPLPISRLHSSIDHCSPIEHETRYREQRPTAASIPEVA